MSTQQVKTENEATLERLANAIQDGHRRCIDGVRGLISQAKLIGQWLEEAKKLVPHGFWQAWVRDNCKFSHRMAQKYLVVARHYDALVARFNTEDEWTLTEFFAAAAELEAARRRASPREPGKETGGKGGANKVPADPFRLEKRERRKVQKEVEKRQQDGPLAVEKDERVQAFLREQRDRLLRAVKRFANSKDVKEVAGDLNPAHLGVLLLDALKARLDADALFAAPEDADVTDASKPVEPTNRIRHHVNGRRKVA